MTLTFDFKIKQGFCGCQVCADFHQAKCSGLRVIVLTVIKTRDKNNTAVANMDSKNSVKSHTKYEIM